ncbi:flagellar hook protein FlgE [Salinisphaera aquimarina]|uniref:Flagellar hook protein FlgE n=1 Tax=Salinisphaera aquimarina TaxID=2094031 RepID=A0ABV7EN64_9GAMM
MGFTQGVSGLNAAASGLDTIGNNIANSQTVGFKTGRSEFADLYAGAKTGLGVQVSGITQSFEGGPLSTTGRSLDLAIDGGGFFRLQDGNQTVYSRDGQFQQTRDGNIANGQGALLTGYNVTNFNDPNAAPRINAGGNPGAIQLPAEGLNARATTDASLQASLDAGAEIIGDTFDSNDSSTYNWSTPSTVFDSLGNAHSINLYFTKTGENQWAVNGEMPLSEESSLPRTVTSGAAYPGTFDPTTSGNGVTRDISVTTNGTDHLYTAVVSGATADAGGTFSGGQIRYVEQLPESTMAFDANGNLTMVSPATGTKADDLPDSAVAFNLDAANGSAPIDFTYDFAGTAQTAQSFAAGNPAQDGYASGSLTGIAIQSDGMIRGNYSNGQSLNLAQVALASFRNEQGLSPAGGNAWTETADSGQPALGTAGVGQLGNLLGGTLEGSNVDLSQQLVDMIVAQRNYQANAQTIKTQDQVLQTAVNLR